MAAAWYDTRNDGDVYYAADHNAMVSALATGTVDNAIIIADGTDGHKHAGSTTCTVDDATGTLTATYFSGDGSGITGVGSTVEANVTIAVKAKVNIKKGQAVFITPGTAAQPDVDLCDPTDTTKSRVLGIAVADITAGSVGAVRRGGTLTNVDTRKSSGGGTGYVNLDETWTEGQLLFVHGSSPGHLTNTRPTSGRSVKVGYTVKGNSSTDSIVVFPMENPVWSTAAVDEDIVLRVGDAAGGKKVSIRDYANSEVAYINSDGLLSATINDYMTLYPAGAMVPTVDPAGMVEQYETSSNKNTYVAGQFLDGGTDELQWLIDFPADWNGDDATAGKIILTPIWTAASGSGTVKFVFTGKLFANDDAIDTALAAIGDSTDTLITAGDLHVSPATTAAVVSPVSSGGKTVILKVTRDSATDTLNATARLIAVRVKYIRTLTT